MNRKDRIDEIINKVLKQYITEANSNYPFKDFINDIKKLGFECRNGEGSCMVFTLKDDNRCNITVHQHGTIGNVTPNTLRHVKDELNKIGWFKNKKNMDNFPFNKWGLNKDCVDSVDDDNAEENEINQANAKYSDAKLYNIFNTKDSIYAMEYNRKVNLCNGINDRRPLLDKWFDEFKYHNNVTPCLYFDDYENMETKVYPINQDGTLDYTNCIIENLMTWKKLI